MTRAITVRLEEADYAALEKQADHVGMRPGLNKDALARDGAGGRDALERLVRRSRQRAPADAMALVADARAALEPDR